MGLPLGEPFRGLSEGTLGGFCQSRSRRITLASCLVQGSPLSGCGVQRERSDSKSTLISIPLHLFCIDIAPFASPQASSLEHALRHNPAELLETTSHEFNSTGPVLLKDG
jgi:hypothetical protein